MSIPQQNTVNNSVFSWKPSVSAPILIVLVVFWIALVDNQTLWGVLHERIDTTSMKGMGYLVSIFGLMVLLLVAPLFVLGQRYLLKPIVISLLIISGVLAYFTQQMGVVYDIEMVRNAFETVRDRNVQEGTELVSSSLIYFLLITTLIPVVFVMRTRIFYGSLLGDQLRRVGWLAGIFFIVANLVVVNYKYITFFSRENNDLEVYLNPLYPIKTTKQLLTRHYKSRNFNFTNLGDDALQQKSSTERTVGVMVVGETSRRGNWSLNGYDRMTNPELKKRQIINFNNATSCGTSTAYSVPCMFSFLNQDNYSPEKASTQSNVLDVLETAGVKTVWVDSNSSCKGVCKRIESKNITGTPEIGSPLYVDGAWYDEVLLDSIDTYLDSTESDILLVLHTMGSHGPAYYRRYPDEFAKFIPYCQSKAPQDCTSTEIINAYDNTILYTDHVLGLIIDKLDARQGDSFMVYASDHGESLGENGIYLHGLPRFLAPAVQSEIPIVGWFSEGFLTSRHLPPGPKDVNQVDTRITHDNLSASLLGLYSVTTALYVPELDLFRFGSTVFTPLMAARKTGSTVRE